jgi:hypothetical protein
MAQRVVLIDDLDGSEGDETVTYAVDGQECEIDLSEKNAQKLRDALAAFIEKSRPVQRQTFIPTPPTRSAGTRRKSSGSGGASGRSDLGDIRAWAQSQGMKVAERGRNKKDIIDAYDEAHK